MPPAEPPPQETEPGSALSLATRSAIDLIGESAVTAIISYSPVSRASGVTSSRRHRRLVGEDGADHDQAADQDRVAAALLAGDELGEPDRAAGTRDVLDLHARGEAGLLERRLHGPRGLVPAAAGAGGGDDLQALDLGLRRQLWQARASLPEAMAMNVRRSKLIGSSLASGLAHPKPPLACLSPGHPPRRQVPCPAALGSGCHRESRPWT